MGFWAAAWTGGERGGEGKEIEGREEVREREGNVEGERETGGERGEKEGERRKGWGE